MRTKCNPPLTWSKQWGGIEIRCETKTVGVITKNAGSFNGYSWMAKKDEQHWKRVFNAKSVKDAKRQVIEYWCEV